MFLRVPAVCTVGHCRYTPVHSECIMHSLMFCFGKKHTFTFLFISLHGVMLCDSFHFLILYWVFLHLKGHVLPQKHDPQGIDCCDTTVIGSFPDVMIHFWMATDVSYPFLTSWPISWRHNPFPVSALKRSCFTSKTWPTRNWLLWYNSHRIISWRHDPFLDGHWCQLPFPDVMAHFLTS